MSSLLPSPEAAQQFMNNADKGPVAIPNDEWPSMVDKLLRTAGSVNLFCTRS